MRPATIRILPEPLRYALVLLCLTASLRAQPPATPSQNSAGHPAPFIPTARGADHFGVTVPDLEKGIAFFHDVLGADLLWKLPVSGLPGDEMQARYRVDSRAQVGLAMLRLGPSINVELLEFHAPGQNLATPSVDEVGTPRLGFYVDDVDAASRWLEQHGCVLLGGPNSTPPGSPHAGQQMRCAVTPLHLTIELVSRPEHLPYEQDTAARLAKPAPAWTADGNTAATNRLPTAHGLDHVGLNVPDLREAIRYFVDVFGAELLWTDGPFTGPGGDAMRQTYGGGTRDTLSLAMLRCGPNLNLELLEYRDADGRTIGRLRPGSDVDAGHLAFYVDNIAAAAAYLQGRKGTVVLAGPNLDDGAESPKRGELHRYFLTSWGASLELVQRPAHLPYESQAAARLAPPPAAWKP